MTTLEIPGIILSQIHAYGERAYPEEGAGLLLGKVNEGNKRGVSILSLPNAREDIARHNRYLFSPQEYLLGASERLRALHAGQHVFARSGHAGNHTGPFDREWAW